jgi:hypothetical protein
MFLAEKPAPYTKQDLRDVFDTGEIQVFSSSPSFHWQGMNYNLSVDDASIYPTTIAPSHWNQQNLHGPVYYLDKHLGGLIKNIKFWYLPMSRLINRKLGGIR